jgi:Protein of unknown function (DUF4235)
MKLLYKPFGLLLGIFAGALARQIFNFIWSRFDEEEPPEPTTKCAPTRKLVAAAAIQGATFRVTKMAVARAGARGFEHVTGVWPGEKTPDHE